MALHPMAYHRRRVGWSQADLASEAGVHVRSVIRLELGQPVDVLTVLLCGEALLERGGADFRGMGHALRVTLETQVNLRGRGA